jgi:site-specific recombinase XerD
MEHSHPRLIDGTAALSVSEQVEAEFAKDRWDAHNIPGLRYAPHTANYHIDFQLIPVVFRPTVKEFMKFKVATGVTTSTLVRCTYCLRNFLTFFSTLYPHMSTLQGFSKQDMDMFILDLRAKASVRGLRDVNQHVAHHVLYVEDFLHYLERSQSPLKPDEPTTCIIWPHHYPKRDKSGSGRVKYIPQKVLDQLDAHIQDLSPTVIPIVILLRASGWRISDVLYLKTGTCLEQEDEKFWLVGDIQKTRLLGHRIPITKEVAAVVLAQIEWVKQHYTTEENPKQWLFPASKRHRNSRRFQYGDPLFGTSINQVLNLLAEKCHIKDDQDNIFHFRLHAFRHTKGIELVNNGMSLTMVQQWMAHASPEMTIISAKILDETMRAQWEKTLQHGIVQFNDGRPEYVAGKKMLTVLDEQQAFDPARVRDYRNNTKLPVGNCVKPPKLICKFTELPCFHCPAYVLTPEDLPALEAYEQQLLERIEIGKQASNTYWIEINQRNLDERVRPAIALLKQGQIVAKSEKYEREYTPEEWEQRQEEKPHA